MEHLSNQASLFNETTSANTARRAYVAPHLVEYGSVAKLTQGSGSPDTDMGSMAGTMGGRSSPGDAPAKMR
jgi:hypothetical protein